MIELIRKMVTASEAPRLIGNFMGAVLKDAGIPTRVFVAKETTHTRINDNLGLPDDPPTKRCLNSSVNR